MDFIKQPMEIENRSMEIIAPHLEGLNLSPEQVKVYSRLIHAAGDVDYAPIIKMSADAIEQAMTALKGGCDIYTDVEMVRTGINKRKLASFGGQVHCLIADEEVAKTAKAQGSTRSLAALRNTLLLQLGADVDAKIELTTPIDGILSVDNATQLLGRGFDMEKNYSYQLLEQNEKLAKKNVTMAWMDFTPTLSAYYQYSAKTYFGKDEGFNMTPPNMVGASVSVPLFTSGTRVASVKSAKIDYQEAVNSKRQAEDGLRVQYNQLCYDLATALETYDIQSRNMEVTQRVFNNVAEKYRYGRASSLEVTTASTDIITAQSNYIQAVMSVVSAQVALENLLNN